MDILKELGVEPKWDAEKWHDDDGDGPATWGRSKFEAFKTYGGAYNLHFLSDGTLVMGKMPGWGDIAKLHDRVFIDNGWRFKMVFGVRSMRTYNTGPCPDAYERLLRETREQDLKIPIAVDVEKAAKWVAIQDGFWSSQYLDKLIKEAEMSVNYEWLISKVVKGTDDFILIRDTFGFNKDVFLYAHLDLEKLLEVAKVVKQEMEKKDA